MSGLALTEKISNSHSTWNLDRLKTTWGNAEGNPLWEEVRATVEMVGVHFC